MSNAVTKQIGQIAKLVASFTNPDGTVGNVVGIPVWTSDNPAVCDPAGPDRVISADGLTVNAPVKAVGVANITCDGQGDPVVGADDVKLVAIVTGIVQEISGGAIEAS